jgi:hypothetical protein
MARRVKPSLGQFLPHFLDAQRNLELLHLQSHAPSVASPSVLSDLQEDALAKVTSFSGALVQAQVLLPRDSLNATGARCDDPSAVERGRNARLTTRAHFSHNCVPA